MQSLAKENPQWAALIQSGKFDEVKAELSKIFKADEIAQVNPKSIGDIFKNDTPTLATIKKYQGERKSRAAIEFCLWMINDFFGAKSGLSDGQLKMLSDLIYSEYYYLTIADLKYCIRQGLLGRYEEKIFGKVTPDVIMRWLSIHIEQRNNEAEVNSISSHQARMKQQQRDFENGVFETEAAERVRMIREALESKWAKNRQDKEWSVFYSTLEQYCEAKGLDAHEIRLSWNDEFADCDGEVDKEDFLKWKENQFLHEINKLNS